jgi:hypothetical protein
MKRKELSPISPISSPEKNFPKKENKKTFCLCKMPDTGEVMIQCVKCEEWYHPKCVNLKKIPDSDYTCFNCIKKNLNKKFQVKEKEKLKEEKEIKSLEDSKNELENEDIIQTKKIEKKRIIRVVSRKKNNNNLKNNEINLNEIQDKLENKSKEEEEEKKINQNQIKENYNKNTVFNEKENINDKINNNNNESNVIIEKNINEKALNNISEKENLNHVSAKSNNINEANNNNIINETNNNNIKENINNNNIINETNNNNNIINETINNNNINESINNNVSRNLTPMIDLNIKKQTKLKKKEEKIAKKLLTPERVKFLRDKFNYKDIIYPNSKDFKLMESTTLTKFDYFIKNDIYTMNSNFNYNHITKKTSLYEEFVIYLKENQFEFGKNDIKLKLTSKHCDLTELSKLLNEFIIKKNYDNKITSLYTICSNGPKHCKNSNCLKDKTCTFQIKIELFSNGRVNIYTKGNHALGYAPSPPVNNLSNDIIAFIKRNYTLKNSIIIKQLYDEKKINLNILLSKEDSDIDKEDIEDEENEKIDELPNNNNCDMLILNKKEKEEDLLTNGHYNITRKKISSIKYTEKKKKFGTRFNSFQKLIEKLKNKIENEDIYFPNIGILENKEDLSSMNENDFQLTFYSKSSIKKLAQFSKSLINFDTTFKTFVVKNRNFPVSVISCENEKGKNEVLFICVSSHNNSIKFTNLFKKIIKYMEIGCNINNWSPLCVIDQGKTEISVFTSLIIDFVFCKFHLVMNLDEHTKEFSNEELYLLHYHYYLLYNSTTLDIFNERKEDFEKIFNRNKYRKFYEYFDPFLENPSIFIFHFSYLVFHT